MKRLRVWLLFYYDFCQRAIVKLKELGKLASCMQSQFSFVRFPVINDPNETDGHYSNCGVTFSYAPVFQYTWGAYSNRIPVYVCPWGCAVHHLAYMYCTTQGVYRNEASVCICTWWGSGILSKPECYSDTTLTWVAQLVMVKRFCSCCQSNGKPYLVRL